MTEVGDVNEYGKNQENYCMQRPTQSRLASIWWRMAENIDVDHLEIFLITSRAEGRERSDGRPFGVGKSTFAVWMAYRAWAYYKGLIGFDSETMELIDETDEATKIEIMKEILNKFLVFKLIDIYKRAVEYKFIPAIILDDVQKDCPKRQHIPDYQVKEIQELTRLRQRIANIIMTAPSMGSIAKPLRDLISWEIIIPRRGVYEIQYVYQRRDFYNPTEDRGRLVYDSTGTFEELPKEVTRSYKIFRDEDVVESLKEMIKRRERERKEDEEEAEEEGDCV